MTDQEKLAAEIVKLEIAVNNLAASVKRYLFWRRVGIVVGSIIGGVVGTLVIRWLS